MIFPTGACHIEYMSPVQAQYSEFTTMLRNHEALIYKVCYAYATDGEHLRDLYQEVVANVWAGWDNFSGKSKVSTWIWRIAINTCITFYKRHGKHNDADRLDDKTFAIPVDDEHARMLRDMYELIGRLDPIDKALVMLWLDEHSYEEIASVLGLTPTNVGSRLSRIRRKLSDMARE